MITINYCPEHGDLLARPGDGADTRSYRCREAHHIDEIHAGFRRSEVPEPSTEHECDQCGEVFSEHSCKPIPSCIHLPASIGESALQSEPSDAVVLAALNAEDNLRAVQGGYKPSPEPEPLSAWRAHDIERMRGVVLAALRAASGVPEPSAEERDLIDTANQMRKQTSSGIKPGSLIGLWLRTASALEARINRSSEPQGEPSVNRVWPATLVGAVESEDAQTIQRLRGQIEEARMAWWSATEQGDNGLVYTDKIEDAMDDIWSAIGHADWEPGAAGGAR
ncbi:hypothetical protein [Microbacterium sp. NPDC078849]|uniref:hypothetical protein n=1 Tax=unclassified Microbacterium TaxID=2609290 RepID=UPI00344F457F